MPQKLEFSHVAFAAALPRRLQASLDYNEPIAKLNAITRDSPTPADRELYRFSERRANSPRSLIFEQARCYPPSSIFTSRFHLAAIYDNIYDNRRNPGLAYVAHPHTYIYIY